MQDQTEREHTDQQILDYERTLKDPESTPFISPLLQLTSLSPDYVDAVPALQQKLLILQETYKSYRKVKRDGNCFYRAFAYLLATHTTTFPTQPSTLILLSLLRSSPSFLTAAGYDLTAIEDFHEETLTLLSPHPSLSDMHDTFNAGYTSESAVCYLRLIAAAVLKSTPEFYGMFVEIPLEVFIAVQVEPSTLAHIVALAAFFRLKIVLVTLDASVHLSPTQISTTIVPDGLVEDAETIVMTMFYKPGHYDLIYR